MIGKWLAAGARLFIFDEPTRGIDVGAKAEIFALIDQLVAEGAGVLMISSEQTEIVHVCDRAYVMRAGPHRRRTRRAPSSPRTTSCAWGCTMSAGRYAPRSSPLAAQCPGVAIVLVLAVLRCSALASPGFPTLANLSNILVQSTILLLLALPMTLIIMTEGLDLSMGAVLTLASIVLAIDGRRHRLARARPLRRRSRSGSASALSTAGWSRCSTFRRSSRRSARSASRRASSLVVTDGQSVVGIPRGVQQIYSAGPSLGMPMPILIGARGLSPSSTSCSIARASAPTSSRSAATAKR